MFPNDISDVLAASYKNTTAAAREGAYVILQSGDLAFDDRPDSEICVNRWRLNETLDFVSRMLKEVEHTIANAAWQLENINKICNLNKVCSEVVRFSGLVSQKQSQMKVIEVIGDALSALQLVCVQFGLMNVENGHALPAVNKPLRALFSK